MTRSDVAFVDAFESCTPPAEAFRHANHVRLAWFYLRRRSWADALAQMSGAFVTSPFITAPRRSTTTRYRSYGCASWQTRRRGRRTLTRSTRSSAHPHLGDKALPYRYYSAQRLDSDAARAGWVEPDLLPLS